MTDATIHRLSAFEDSGPILMARIVGSDGAAILRAGITSITYTVYDISQLSPTNIATGSPLTVANVIYDTLQTEDIWTADSTGYNFEYAVDADELPTGGGIYRFEFIVTPTSGQPIVVVFEIEAKKLYGS